MYKLLLQMLVMQTSGYKTYLGKDSDIEDRQTLVVERLLEH